jgi:hypothetical protein
MDERTLQGKGAGVTDQIKVAVTVYRVAETRRGAWWATCNKNAYDDVFNEFLAHNYSQTQAMKATRQELRRRTPGTLIYWQPDDVSLDEVLDRMFGGNYEVLNPEELDE